MTERFEVTFSDPLADLLVEELRAVIKRAGFGEAVRVPGPEVIAFMRGDDVVTMQTESVGHHRRRVRLESESVDVAPLAADAARAVILAITRHFVEAMPGVDRESLEAELDALLRDRLP